MTFYTNFSSASKSISFYKRTSSPIRRRRVPLTECKPDVQYDKWCDYLHQAPKKLRVRGMSPVPKGILAGHFVSTESLTEDAEGCCEDAEECYEDAEECCEDGVVWHFIYNPTDTNANEKLEAKPNTDINENRNKYERIHRNGDTSLDVIDIKQRLLEDIKFYKKVFKKRHVSRKNDYKGNVATTDEKEGLERRLKDRLKVLFSKHSDWLKKTVSALKNRDAKCCKQHEKFMGISFCKA